MNKYIIGLSGQMFDHTNVWEHIESAKQCGYNCIELRSTHVRPDMDKGYLAAVRDAIHGSHLVVSALSCFTGNFALLNDSECHQALVVFQNYVELADYFDAMFIRVWPGWIESEKADQPVWDRASIWMKKAGNIALQHNRKIVMEMHHGTLCDRAQSSLKLLEMIDCSSVGLTFDPVNLYQVPTDYTKDCIEALKNYIFNVHIKDIVKLENDFETGCFAYSYYAKHIGRFTKVIGPGLSTERYYAHRRIGHGGVDWHSVIALLDSVGYNGPIVIESVSESNPHMPTRTALAKCCFDDIHRLMKRPEASRAWKHLSPTFPGLHKVISPEISDCRAVTVYRLNIDAGDKFLLKSGREEINALLVTGDIAAISTDVNAKMSQFDSFFIPGGYTIELTAAENSVLYLGASICEGYGKPFYRKFDLSLPLGDIHQVHGSGSGKREVFFTLNPEMPASRLICGVSFSQDGAWTSWPPHQHEVDLEEVYCYFGYHKPNFAFHLSYTESGQTQNIMAHLVNDGTMVLAPRGYHPTVASPGVRNAYFWVLAAFSHDSRRYDLAVEDPAFI